MRPLGLIFLLLWSISSSALLQDAPVAIDLARRQDSSSNINTAEATQSDNKDADSTTSTSAASSSETPDSTITSNSDSKSTGTNSRQPLTTAKTIAQNAPAGGISMISPAAATTAYYKVGQKITFVWNYTSLLAPPSAINILVSNTVSTYTLTQNATVQPTGRYVWDTEQYDGKQNPLVNAFYTMGVYDAGEAYNAVPKPGHLGANGLNPPFGIYATQTPAVANVLECVTCTGAAVSNSEQQTMRFLLVMIGFTLVSFMYFSNGFLGGL